MNPAVLEKRRSPYVIALQIIFTVFIIALATYWTPLALCIVFLGACAAIFIALFGYCVLLASVVRLIVRSVQKSTGGRN